MQNNRYGSHRLCNMDSLLRCLEKLNVNETDKKIYANRIQKIYDENSKVIHDNLGDIDTKIRLEEIRKNTHGILSEEKSFADYNKKDSRKFGTPKNSGDCKPLLKEQILALKIKKINKIRLLCVIDDRWQDADLIRTMSDRHKKIIDYGWEVRFNGYKSLVEMESMI